MGLLERLGFPDLALMAAEDSVILDRELKLDRLLHQDLLAIGNAHLNLGNVGKAEACYREALDIAIGREDWANAASASTNLGNVAAQREDFPTAIEHYEKSLEYLAKEPFPDTEMNTRMMLLQVSEIQKVDVERVLDNARRLCEGFGRTWTTSTAGRRPSSSSRRPIATWPRTRRRIPSGGRRAPSRRSSRSVPRRDARVHPRQAAAYQPWDPIVTEAIEAALAAVSSFEKGASLDALRICLFDPDTASAELRRSPYATQALQALVDERLIVVNERFLRGVEAAVRSFGQADTLLGAPFKDDAQMFGLARRIDADPARYLARLRRQGQAREDQTFERDLRRELALVVLFFLGHELGHFIGGHPTSEYATFLDPRAPLERRIEDAVVKLCRHVDEFVPTQFQLPGFEQTADAGSDVRRVEAALRGRDHRRYQDSDAFFVRETQADEWANAVVVAHLASLAASDAVDAERALYPLGPRRVRGRPLRLVSGSRPLRAQDRVSGRSGKRASWALVMMRGRETYVHAASLFGERHRFTLLRAALALEAVLRERTPWFAKAPDARTIWCAPDAAAKIRLRFGCRSASSTTSCCASAWTQR